MNTFENRIAEADAITDIPKRIEEYQVIVQVWASNHEERIRTWEKVLSLDPTHTEAFEQLEKLNAHNHEYVSSLYKTRLRAAITPEQRTDLVLKASALTWYSENWSRFIELFAEISSLLENEWRSVLILYRIAESMQEELSRPKSEATRRWHSLIVAYEEQLRNRLNISALPSVRPEPNVQLSASEWLTKANEALTQNKPAQAIECFLRLLDLEPDHLEALSKLESIYAQLGKWNDVAEIKERRIQWTTNEIKRVTLLKELADIHDKNRKDPMSAIECLERARDISPRDFQLMNTLMPLYQSQKSWAPMVRLIRQIADLESDPIKSSKYHFTIGNILANELKESDEAIDEFNAALDLNPLFLEAFKSIDAILTNQRQWTTLERHYRKMIVRLRSDNQPTIAAAFWKSLGLLYRDRLSNPNAAAEAFKMVAEISPQPEIYQDLASIYASQELHDEAIIQWHKVLTHDPMHHQALFGLYDAYTQSHRYDQAFCVASTTYALFREGTREDITQFYKSYQQPLPPIPKARLDEELWIKQLFHHDNDVFIGKIFASILPTLRRLKVTNPPSQFGLLASENQDPTRSSLAFVKNLWLCGSALNINPMPLVFARALATGGVGHVLSDPPAVLLGSGVLQGISPMTARFIAAKNLTYYRPEHYVRLLFPTVVELTPLLLAALGLGHNDVSLPSELQSVAQTLASQLQKSPVEFEALRKVVGVLISHNHQVDVRQWFQGVEHTSLRAGFLLSGDLDSAKVIIDAEPAHPNDASAKEKFNELVKFSLSQEYFTLRQAIGIAIGQ